MALVDTLLFFLRAILGLLLIFFIPGFAFTWVLYTRKEDISLIVRIALSCVLSIAIVMLSSLFLDFVFGIETTGLNVAIMLLVITVYLIILYPVRVNQSIYVQFILRTFSVGHQDLQKSFSRKINSRRDKFTNTAMVVVVYHESQQSDLNHIDHSYLLDVGEEIAIQQVEENKLKVTDSVMLQPPYPKTRYFELEIREYKEEALSLVDDLQIYPVLVAKTPGRTFRGFVLQRGTIHISERIYKKTSTTEVQWIYSHDFHIFAIVNAEDTLNQMVDRIMGKLDEIVLSLKSGIPVSSQAEERQLLKDEFDAVIEQPRATPARPVENVQQPEVPFSAEPGEIPEQPVIQPAVELRKIPKRPVIQASVEPREIPERPVVPVDNEPWEIMERPVIQPTVEPKETPKRPVIRPGVESREIHKRPVIRADVEPKEIPKRPVIRPGVEPKEIHKRPVIQTDIEPKETPKRPVIQTTVEPNEIPKRPVIQTAVEPREITKRTVIQTDVEPKEIPKRPVIQPAVEPKEIEKRPVIQPGVEPKEIPKPPDEEEDEEPWEIKERPVVPAGVVPDRIVRPPEIQFSVEPREIFKHAPVQHRVEPQDILKRQEGEIGIEPQARDRRKLQKEILRDLDVFGITPDSFGKSKKNIENIIIPKKADVDKKLAEIQEDEDIDWLDLTWLYEE